MLPCDTGKDIPEIKTVHRPTSTGNHSFLIAPFNRIWTRLFAGSTSETLPLPIPSNIPAALPRLARVLKSTELALKKNYIPLTFTSPANVYFECIQEFLSSLTHYSDNTFSNPELEDLIKRSFTSKKEYCSSTCSPFLYFFAVRIARGDRELFIYEKLRYDNWIITIKPMKETFEAAVDLMVRLDVVRSLILADDEPLLLQHLPEFHRSWEVFGSQLIKERTENYCSFCPSIKAYMDTFPEDLALIERCIEKIPLEQSNATTIKCYLAAQKTLELSTNYLDHFGSLFFREVKICNTQPPVL